MSPLSFPLAPDGVGSGLRLVPLPENRKDLFIGGSFTVQGYSRDDSLIWDLHLSEGLSTH